MKKTFYSILAYIFLGLTAVICIYAVYAYATGEGFSMWLLLKGLLGLACGLSLLAEARKPGEGEETGEKTNNRTIRKRNAEGTAAKSTAGSPRHL